MLDIAHLFLRIKYFFKKYKYDFVTFIAAITSLWISEFLNYFKNKPELLSILKGIIILTSSFVVIYLRSRDKQFYFMPLSRRAEKDDWIGKGTFEYDRTTNCYVITNSEAGFIYSKCLDWSDYLLSFKFKILNNNMSVILRAVNLSNCVMLQFGQPGIRPHIRINGAWNWWEHPESKLTFESPLSLDKWYKCQIMCSQDNIRIQLFDDGRAFFQREWKIPEGGMAFKFGDTPIHNITFPINLEYGSIGFRNAAQEKSLIKEVLVQKI
jgi:hypothetical protein